MTSKRVHELAIFDDFVVDGAVVKEEEGLDNHIYRNKKSCNKEKYRPHCQMYSLRLLLLRIGGRVGVCCCVCRCCCRTVFVVVAVGITADVFVVLACSVKKMQNFNLSSEI